MISRQEASVDATEQYSFLNKDLTRGHSVQSRKLRADKKITDCLTHACHVIRTQIYAMVVVIKANNNTIIKFAAETQHVFTGSTIANKRWICVSRGINGTDI